MKTCPQCSKVFPDSEYACRYDGSVLHPDGRSPHTTSHSDLSPQATATAVRIAGPETDVIESADATSRYQNRETKREESGNGDQRTIQEAVPIRSPSLYVTRPSIDRAPLVHGITPSNLPDTEIIPAQAPRDIDSHHAEPPRKTGSNILLIAAGVLAACLAVLGVGGYLVYTKYMQRDYGQRFAIGPSRGDVKASRSGDQVLPGTNRDVDPDQERIAKDHYENGVRHQEQAARLAEAGMSAEAGAESEKAIAEYRQALAIAPKMAKVHENLGVALYNTGQVETAVSEYETAIKLSTSPGAQLLTNYGYALLGARRFSEAAEAFGRALQVEPTDYDLLFYRGSALYFARDMESARAAYNEYLRLAPKGQYADQARGFIAGRSAPAEIGAY